MSEILPDIHRIESVYAGRRLTSYLLTGRRALLIDSGFAHTPDQTILPYMQAAGIPLEALRWLVVTHASGDHFGGNHVMKHHAPEVTIVAHRLDAEAIAHHANLVADHIDILRQEGFPCPQITVNDPDFLMLHGPETSVDWVVEGGEQIDLGDDWRVSLIHAPGHTPGHLMVYEPRHHVLFAGDALMGEGVPDVFGRLVMPPHYFEVAWYLATIRAARLLTVNTLLATHYPPLKGADVAAFLEASAVFVDRFEGVIANTIRTKPIPDTIPALLDRVRAEIGIPDADCQYALLVRAHLRYRHLGEWPRASTVEH